MKSDEAQALCSPSPSNLTESCLSALRLALGKEVSTASLYDQYQSLALAVREKLVARGLATEAQYKQRAVKRVHYLSLEFLIGRALQNAVINLDLEDEARSALRFMGIVLEDLYDQEHDAALGNGGLGRLAACFLDSMATLRLPAVGYGIRYDYGMFDQIIENGYQKEKPDPWLFHGNPWETRRADEMVRVRFYGRTRAGADAFGRYHVTWEDTEDVMALPYEILIPGFRNDIANPLILWTAKPTEEFNLDYFNHGNYFQAVRQKVESEVISKVLYPNDNMELGKELRLKQQYFFVSASLQRILNEFLLTGKPLHHFPDQVAIHLNDTHPTVAIPELMRLLVDLHDLAWDEAWEITRATFAYTNHTLLSEALEKWDLSLFGRLLPRHLEIVYEINERFLNEVRARYPEDPGRIGVVGSHAVNGVAALHTELLKRYLFSDFNELFPERFKSITNGVTQRRWLLMANPALSRLITEAVGQDWVTKLDKLKGLEDRAKDKGFQETWQQIKHLNKCVLADYLERELEIRVDPDMLFDVHVKRIHEYKRQLLNILHVIARYLRIRDGEEKNPVPRTVLIGGKAAPGYYMAKLIIKLANDVARVINGDPKVKGHLKLVFVPNYRVSMAERIFPGSDLSQQISMAGMEASGTGNMKFALNGALTIGTLDGANIEIRDCVGEDNIFIFGMTEAQIAAMKANGYNPEEIFRRNAEVKRVVEMIGRGFFSPDDPDRFKPILRYFFQYGDPYCILADFASYMECQARVDACYRDREAWTEKSIRNVANMGFFSSDRTVMQYAQEIWGIEPLD
ncbi:MAG: glycogen/starch/alpha-glucan phosphorylase [Planctomycetota bacterium]|jgi:starch phosphorylase